MRMLLVASLVLTLTACDDDTRPLDASARDGGLDAGETDAAVAADAAPMDAGVEDAATDAGDGAAIDAGVDAAPVCEESPCRLVSPQCGCPSGERCTIDDDALPHCVADGTATEGESCAVADCAAGFVCAESPELSMCVRFCESDADCTSGPGSQCLYDFGGPRACTVGCDPVHDTGCPIGGGCTVKRVSKGGPGFTDCRPAGAGVAGDPCVIETDCEGGHLCASIDGVRQCLKWCTSVADCPADQGCNLFPDLIIGSDLFGYCG